MNINQLRAVAGTEIIDYPFLVAALRQYEYPRNRISRWLKTKALIRVKKGLYVFGPAAARTPFVPEILANLIYGPSYLSLEYAMAYHGLIPERVSEFTSVTYGRNRRFHTPVGTFSYRHLRRARYAIGFSRQTVSTTENFLMATPEKALVDYFMLRVKPQDASSHQSLEELLFDNLRIDVEVLESLSRDRLTQIANIAHSRTAANLVNWMRKWTP